MANEKVNTEIDVTQAMIGYDGKPLTDPTLDEKGKPVLDEAGQPVRENVPFRTIAFMALDAVGKLDADRALGGEKKLMAYKLAHKIATSDKVALLPDEIGFLEQRIGMTFPMNVVGACAMILNPASIKKD